LTFKTLPVRGRQVGKAGISPDIPLSRPQVFCVAPGPLRRTIFIHVIACEGEGLEGQGPTADILQIEGGVQAGQGRLPRPCECQEND